MKLFSTLFGVSMLAAAASGSPTSFGELMTPTAPLKRAAQAITQVTNFGANTSGTKMYIYVPSKLAASPPIIVAIHYCTGTAQGYYNGSPYAQLADQKGFIVIYPESPYSGTCWDVSSRAALTHNGGGDSNSIANMVTYALKQYNGDASKVFVTGSSSGAMMTVCLLGKRDFAVDRDEKRVILSCCAHADLFGLRTSWRQHIRNCSPRAFLILGPQLDASTASLAVSMPGTALAQVVRSIALHRSGQG